MILIVLMLRKVLGVVYFTSPGLSTGQIVGQYPRTSHCVAKQAVGGYIVNDG